MDINETNQSAIKILEESFLSEMANLDKRHHGIEGKIKMHIYQPGKLKVSGHGPRLKVFMSGDPNNYFSMSIEDRPKVVKNNPLNVVNRKDFKKVTSFISKNVEALLDFWMDKEMIVDDLYPKLKK